MRFVILKKQLLANTHTTVTTTAHFDSFLNEVVETVPMDQVFDALKVPPKYLTINVKGKYLTEVLLRAITPCYLRGTEVIVNGIHFPVCTSNPQYLYIWQDQVPAKLPQHLKDAFYNYRLRGSLYNELVAWNQSRIQLATNKSKFKWELAENFYKSLFKTFYGKIKVLSPNKKTFFESTAELDLENWIPNANPLTQEEQTYLAWAETHQYLKALGLPDCSFQIGSQHRITSHGVTNEPILINKSDINAVLTASVFKKKVQSGDKSSVWKASSSRFVTSVAKQSENIQMLKWYLSLPTEELESLLLPGWHVCPECGSLYNEHEGCCSIEPIKFIPYNENHEEECDMYLD